MLVFVFGILNDNVMCCLEVDEEWVIIFWFYEYWICLIFFDGKNFLLDGSLFCFFFIFNIVFIRKFLKFVFLFFNVIKRKI